MLISGLVFVCEQGSQMLTRKQVMSDQIIDQQSTAPASKTEKGMLAPAGSGGLRQMLRAKR